MSKGRDGLDVARPFSTRSRLAPARLKPWPERAGENMVVPAVPTASPRVGARVTVPGSTGTLHEAGRRSTKLLARARTPGQTRRQAVLSSALVAAAPPSLVSSVVLGSTRLAAPGGKVTSPPVARGLDAARTLSTRNRSTFRRGLGPQRCRVGQDAVTLAVPALTMASPRLGTLPSPQITWSIDCTVAGRRSAKPLGRPRLLGYTRRQTVRVSALVAAAPAALVNSVALDSAGKAVARGLDAARSFSTRLRGLDLQAAQPLRQLGRKIARVPALGREIVVSARPGRAVVVANPAVPEVTRAIAPLTFRRDGSVSRGQLRSRTVLILTAAPNFAVAPRAVRAHAAPRLAVAGVDAGRTRRTLGPPLTVAKIAGGDTRTLTENRARLRTVLIRAAALRARAAPRFAVSGFDAAHTEALAAVPEVARPHIVAALAAARIARRADRVGAARGLGDSAVRRSPGRVR